MGIRGKQLNFNKYVIAAFGLALHNKNSEIFELQVKCGSSCLCFPKAFYRVCGLEHSGLGTATGQPRCTASPDFPEGTAQAGCTQEHLTAVQCSFSNLQPRRSLVGFKMTRKPSFRVTLT